MSPGTEESPNSPRGRPTGDNGPTTPAAPDDLPNLPEVSDVTDVHTDGSVAGYRAHRTLRLSVELQRQWRRKRTQLVLAFLALLPCILVVALEIGEHEPDRRSTGFIDLATASAPNFAVLALFVSGSFLLPMIVALYFGDTVASEASWASLKYLLSIPVPRHRLLRQKTAASAVLSTCSLAVLPLVSLGLGTLWYGTGAAVSPDGDALPFGDSVVALALGTAYIVIQLSWVAALGLLLSVSANTPLGAVGGTLLVSVLSQILDQLTVLGDLRDFLPTHFTFAWLDLIATDIDWTEMATGALSAALYATVFYLLAAYRFARKDIMS